MRASWMTDYNSNPLSSLNTRLLSLDRFLGLDWVGRWGNDEKDLSEFCGYIRALPMFTTMGFPLPDDLEKFIVKTPLRDSMFGYSLFYDAESRKPVKINDPTAKDV
jgi:hypothetical protein